MLTVLRRSLTLPVFTGLCNVIPEIDLRLLDDDNPEGDFRGLGSDIAPKLVFMGLVSETAEDGLSGLVSPDKEDGAPPC